MLNFNVGRSFFFSKGTKEIKFLSNEKDAEGRLFAKVTDLVTGKRTLVLVTIGKGDGRETWNLLRGLPITIH